MAKNWYPVIDILTCGEYLTSFRRLIYCRKAKKGDLQAHFSPEYQAGNGNLLWGILLMLLYSIGHSALVMVAGTSVGFVQRISGNTRYNKAETVLKVIMGTAILLIGFYMFWLAF